MPPSLEKLLLDTDLNVEIEPYLRALGFRTRFALRVRADERDDVDLLRWARRNGYILVCHDKHRDRNTQLRLYPELYQNGGKILRIAGDSSQDVLTAVGKVLIDREKWVDWFESNDGIVIVRSNNRPVFQNALELYTRVQQHLPGAVPPQRFDRRSSGSRRRRRPLDISDEQQRLIDQG